MLEHPRSVLFGCVEPERIESLRDRLQRDGARVFASSRTEEFLDLAKRGSPDVIVLDDDLDALGGEMLIRLLRASCPQSRVILLLPPGSPPAREGLRHLGPVCTLVSPVPDENLKGVIGTALQMPNAVPAPLPPERGARRRQEAGSGDAGGSGSASAAPRELEKLPYA